MTVTKVEIALLVLAYLKDEKFKETHEVFQKESAQLLSKLTWQTKRQVKSLTSILNEYLLLKEEQKKKSTFMQSFGRDPYVKSTMSKLVTLLDDFSAYRSTIAETTPVDLVYQAADAHASISKPAPVIERTTKVKETPQPTATPSFTSNISLQDIALATNTNNFPTLVVPSTTSSKPTDMFPSPRRKPITPKKLKPSTESTVTPTRKNLSFDSHTPLNLSTNNSLNSSISPKLLDEENIVRALLEDIQFQEKLAQQINTHLPSDSLDLDLSQEYLFQQHQMNNPIPPGLSTDAVQDIINNLTSESVLENYFNSISNPTVSLTSNINQPNIATMTSNVTNDPEKRKVPPREEDNKRSKTTNNNEDVEVDVSNLDVDDFLSTLNYTE